AQRARSLCTRRGHVCDPRPGCGQRGQLHDGNPGDQSAPLAIVHPALRCCHPTAGSSRLAPEGGPLSSRYLPGHRPGTRLDPVCIFASIGRGNRLPRRLRASGFLRLPADLSVGAGGKNAPAGETVGGRRTHSLSLARRVGDQTGRASFGSPLDFSVHLRGTSRSAPRAPSQVATVSAFLTVGLSLFLLLLLLPFFL